jgi:glucose-6-phosphate 1-dehydrogenase
VALTRSGWREQRDRSLFTLGSGVGAQGPDHLTFDLADASNVSLSFHGKRPGPAMTPDKLSMQFSTQEIDTVGDLLAAYEWLTLEAMRDRTTGTPAGCFACWATRTC